MLEFLLYDLKVAVLIAVFYLFYRLLLSRDNGGGIVRVAALCLYLPSYCRLGIRSFQRCHWKAIGDNRRTFHDLVADGTYRCLLLGGVYSRGPCRMVARAGGSPHHA